jgi:PAS domain S-box-containing protein
MAPYTSNHSEIKFIPESEFYSQVIECLQDYSIITINNALQINSWSSGAISIFGYSLEEITGKSFDIIYTEEDRKNKIPELEIETADKAGKAVDNRWHVCKDGSKFFAYGLVFPLTDTEGKKIGYVKILRDITERKKPKMHSINI